MEFEPFDEHYCFNIPTNLPGLTSWRQ